MKIKNSKLKVKNYSLKRKVVMALFALITLHLTSEANAQTPALDPNTWQAGATGLQTQRGGNSDKMAGGLILRVADKSWPFLSLNGGLQDSGWGKVSGPVGIELGFIKVTGEGSSVFSGESADWAHNEMIFNNGTASEIKIWVSRLSPALLVRSPSNSLRLLSGDLNTFVSYSQTQQTRLSAPSYPKYVAYSSGSRLFVQRIPASGDPVLPLPVLDNNWLLVWYGNNSHFRETKRPNQYPYPSQLGCCDGDGTVSAGESYQADVPLLIRFEQSPATIKQSSEGGIDLTFSSSAGYFSILPLLGKDHLNSATTETWGAALSNDVVTKINDWLPRLCFYPTLVKEGYSYDINSDTVTISEEINFMPICGTVRGIQFALVPPFLALAKDKLGVSFSHNLIDGKLPTDFGPVMGFENTAAYSWSLSGLKKYVNLTRTSGNGEVPPELQQTLISQVNKVVTAGHYAPWIFADKWPMMFSVGEIYWLNPADILYQLSEIIPALADSVDPQAPKNRLLEYIKSERAAYPPETVYNLSLSNGAQRQDYSSPDHSSLFSRWTNERQDVFMKRVWLYNFYSLARYYDLTGESLPAQVASSARTVLNQDMAEQDWATMYWFKGFADRRIPVVNSNRHLAGLIGVIRLFRQANDSQAEGLSQALLAKAAVSRIAMVEYINYLYANNLVVLPVAPSWAMADTAGMWLGLLYNYSWQGNTDDVRQVAILDQFGLNIHDSSGYRKPFTGWQDQVPGDCYAYLVPFRDLVPESARLLADHAKNEADITVRKVEAILPHWYAAFSDAILGNEHGIAYPIDSYQIFMAKSWVDNDSSQNLEKYIDIPFTSDGDFFYMHKLAETIKAYQGWRWEDEDIGVGIPGDVNYDSQVDVLDIQACVNHILGIQDLGNRADVNSDGSANVLDVQVIVNIILGV